MRIGADDPVYTAKAMDGMVKQISVCEFFLFHDPFVKVPGGLLARGDCNLSLLAGLFFAPPLVHFHSMKNGAYPAKRLRNEIKARTIFGVGPGVAILLRQKGLYTRFSSKKSVLGH